MDSAVVNTIAEYIKSQPVDKAWLFGSFSRGEERTDSDVMVKSGKDSTNVGMSIFDKMYHPGSLYTIGTDGMPIEEFLRTDPKELFC